MFSPHSLQANSSTTVVVGMSGGVDSSVTAAVLREAGYRVIGLFMKNWEEKDANGVCTSEKDFADVRAVCEKLDIPYYSVEFVQEYWNRVFEDFLRELRAGYTPNPDILCNREIKFDAFFEKAMELGGDFLATGHYARTRLEGGRPLLLKGHDPKKDQSYFLHAIQGERLRRVMFPIGDIEKTEVRKIAERFDLATKAKKDSTGICFIGERNFQPFVAQYLKGGRGEFRKLSGEVVGHHVGAVYYTQGQRKGLGLGGEGEAWFVVGKDVAKNIVYVERGETHPALYADDLIAENLTFIGEAPKAGDTWGVSGDRPLAAKVRYRQADQECRAEFFAGADGFLRARVIFARPQRAITLGQSVVFYSGDECLGGGIIREVGESYAARGFSLSEMAERLTPASTNPAPAYPSSDSVSPQST